MDIIKKVIIGIFALIGMFVVYTFSYLFITIRWEPKVFLNETNFNYELKEISSKISIYMYTYNKLDIHLIEENYKNFSNYQLKNIKIFIDDEEYLDKNLDENLGQMLDKDRLVTGVEDELIKVLVYRNHDIVYFEGKKKLKVILKVKNLDNGELISITREQDILYKKRGIYLNIP